MELSFKGQLIGGAHVGNIVNVPHITTTSNHSKWPLTLQRCQFPLQLAFAMTINKAQGQTMKIVGIYLLELVFTHGQLYVALSRATHVNHVSIFCPNGRTTTNLIYIYIYIFTTSVRLTRQFCILIHRQNRPNIW